MAKRVLHLADAPAATRWLPSVLGVAREAALSARSARVASLLTITVVAVLCAAVLLTTGRTVGAQNAIVASIDSPSTRSIVVRAPESSGLDATVLSRLAHAAGISSAVAFGPADDVANAVFAGGQRVALRPEYSLSTGSPAPDPGAPTPTTQTGARQTTATQTTATQTPGTQTTGTQTPGTQTPGTQTTETQNPGTQNPAALSSAAHTQPLGAAGPAHAEASVAARRVLGLADGVGAVASVATGATFDVTSTIDLPDYLRFLDPVVVAPVVVSPVGATEARSPQPQPQQQQSQPQPQQRQSQPQPVTVLVVVARSSAQVPAVLALVVSVLGVENPEKVTVTTSTELATLRSDVQTQLGTFSRSLTALIFGVGALMVASIVYGLVMLRRKDFGRRRALGASRPLIVSLVLAQVTMLGVIGSIVGCAASLAVLVALGDPLPTTSFVTALALLATVTAAIAALVPALVASTRDPLRELRVP